jgi:RNA 3'-terminal phosphate cyclase (ATP)
MEQFGLHVTLRLVRPGFYPRGGGVVTARIEPCPRLRGFRLIERRPITTAIGFSAVAGLPTEIARRQARRAVNRLRTAGLRADISEESWDGGPGTVLAVRLDTAPAPTLFFGLGARGKPAERVADEAADQVVDFLQAAPAAVDAHSADQIVLPLALADGPSEFTVAAVTTHLTTNIEVIRRFVERDIAVEGEHGKPGRVTISCVIIADCLATFRRSVDPCLNRLSLLLRSSRARRRRGLAAGSRSGFRAVHCAARAVATRRCCPSKEGRN